MSISINEIKKADIRGIKSGLLDLTLKLTNNLETNRCGLINSVNESVGKRKLEMRFYGLGFKTG